jgi:gas vesicle protein
MSNEAGEKFITGLIVGTVLGLAIGIFAAPASGEETRRVVKEKMGEFNRNAKDKLDEFGRQIKRGAAGNE